MEAFDLSNDIKEDTKVSSKDAFVSTNSPSSSSSSSSSNTLDSPVNPKFINGDMTSISSIKDTGKKGMATRPLSASHSKKLFTEKSNLSSSSSEEDVVKNKRKSKEHEDEENEPFSSNVAVQLMSPEGGRATKEEHEYTFSILKNESNTLVPEDGGQNGSSLMNVSDELTHTSLLFKYWPYKSNANAEVDVEVARKESDMSSTKTHFTSTPLRPDLSHGPTFNISLENEDGLDCDNQNITTKRRDTPVPPHQLNNETRQMVIPGPPTSMRPDQMLSLMSGLLNAFCSSFKVEGRMDLPGIGVIDVRLNETDGTVRCISQPMV